MMDLLAKKTLVFNFQPYLLGKILAKPSIAWTNNLTAFFANSNLKMPINYLQFFLVNTICVTIVCEAIFEKANLMPLICYLHVLKIRKKLHI